MTKEDSLGFALTTTLNTLRKKFNSALKQYNLTSEQFALMKLLEEKKLSPSEIATILARDRANITRIINSLEKKDFIKKENINLRSFKISLTSKGEDVLKEADKIADEFQKRIKELISEDDYKCLIEKLSFIRDNF